MSSQFVVYSVPGSPFGRAVLATLTEKGAPFKFVGLNPGSVKSEPHVSRHPMGRVPVIEHDGFMLYETQAILRYIDRVVPGTPLTPADPKALARMDQVMNISDWYLFQGVNSVIGFNRIVAPRLLGMPCDEAAIAAAMPQAHTVFRELSRLLGSNTFLVGDQLSLADLIVIPHVDLLSETPEWAALTAATPNLASWLERMNTRASLRQTTWGRVAELAVAA
jgi:glutathione S-transferase